MDPISKSQFAKELGVSRCRVSRLLEQGLPKLANGTIDADVAFVWVVDHVDSELGGCEITEDGRRRIDIHALR